MSNSTGFYEDKGMKRRMVIMDDPHFAKLKTFSKGVKLTQGEFLEVLLDAVDIEVLKPVIEAKKNQKGAGKLTKSELIKKMKGLTPEQLAAIEAIVEGG
ncbi:hypothetical protein EZJ19_11570 [Parasulfuritortus cantonensis]|uniref:Uncharacterized protein n=1 Tax=Parasulfuritortus cantonensis TaxID=2528202 RepID=A0A4R1B801_9PROT|nr:hypothetical protein [Parasulfuritortus cantonensis]TCJ12868.1 hypothetical protein EZJ19_11570 [Parasulfuritortus cantonensis]